MAKLKSRNTLQRKKIRLLAARALGLRPQWLKVKGPIPDLEGAFSAMKNERAEALLVLDVPIPVIHQKRIAELAATYRLPTMFLGGRRMSEAAESAAVWTSDSASHRSRSSKAFASFRSCVSKPSVHQA